MTDQEPTMTIAEELMAQRDAVNFGTWVQRNPSMAGEACAAVRAECHPARGLVSYNISQRAAELLTPPNESSLVEWNDAPGRTREEVLDLLDDGIRTAKELGI